MSTPIKDGGPIFPVASTPGYSTSCVEDVGVVHRNHPGTAGSSGMSLRDWFAGQALAGMLADPEVCGGKDSVALHAYGYADAMLKARESQQ